MSFRNDVAEKEVKGRTTRASSQRAASASRTEPNTISPKAYKGRPTATKPLSTPKPQPPPKANYHSSSVKAHVSDKPLPPQVTPVKSTKAPSKDTPTQAPVKPLQHTPEQAKCNLCSHSSSDIISGVKDAVAEVQEELLVAKIKLSKLNLHIQHLLVDPDNNLKELGEQANRILSLCSTVGNLPNLILDKFDHLLAASNARLLQGVELLLQNPTEPAPDQPNKAIDILSGQIEELTRLTKNTCEQNKENHTNSLKLLSQRLDVLCNENKELSRAAQQKLHAVADQLLKHDAKIDELLSKPSSQQQLPQAPVNVHQTPNSQPPPPTQPYIKLTPGFLKAILMTELKVWLAKQSFTRIGNREVLYVGDYDYWYGKVRHNALKPPKVIQDILDLLRDSTGSTANSCLITRYLNGRSTCPEHEDDEAVINPASDIDTLSVGPTRKMILRRKTRDGNIIAEEVELPENSLLTFSRKSQDYYTHEIPADDAIDQVRYSLTFREIKPFYLNSTLLIGDSNCKGMEFGSGKKLCFGKWMPGEYLYTPRISMIPGPEKLLPYRNIILNVGLNDLTVSAPLPPRVLVNQLEMKCHAIHQTLPKTRILLMAVIPTTSARANSWVKEFNYHLNLLSMKDKNLVFVDTHEVLCEPSDPSGLLAAQFASRNNIDIKHLNRSGVYKLRDLFKDSILNLRSLLVSNVKCEIPWFYPAHRPSSPKEQFDRSAVPGMKGRSLSLSSHGSDVSVCESENRSEKVDFGSDSVDVGVGFDSVNVGADSVNAGLVDTPTKLITSDSPPQSQPPLP